MSQKYCVSFFVDGVRLCDDTKRRGSFPILIAMSDMVCMEFPFPYPLGLPLWTEILKTRLGCNLLGDLESKPLCCEKWAHSVRTVSHGLFLVPVTTKMMQQNSGIVTLVQKRLDLSPCPAVILSPFV